ncbi:hypothetical protein [Brevundimonas naejangsanensis]|uniref:hypothetical protein n=1 Tax=Brevundimonas naejangsanensis TaxID=588932 RepID=UPI0039F6F480
MFSTLASPNKGVDTLRWRTYAEAMEEADAYLHFKLDLTNPVELKDFVALFSSLADQYEDYAKANFPSEASEGQFFIKEIRPGCIEGELFPHATGLVDLMDRTLIVVGFLDLVRRRVAPYFSRGGRSEGATRRDLRNFNDVVEAVAKDSDGSLLLEARRKEGPLSTETIFRFDTRQARVAKEEIERHDAEISRREGDNLKRVLMTFYQPNLSDADKSGEKAIVEASGTRKPLPVHWASDLAKAAIKSALREGKAFKLGFYVDVTVDKLRSKPAVFVVTNYHGTVELDDEVED